MLKAKSLLWQWDVIVIAAFAGAYWMISSSFSLDKTLFGSAVGSASLIAGLIVLYVLRREGLREASGLAVLVSGLHLAGFAMANAWNITNFEEALIRFAWASTGIVAIDAIVLTSAVIAAIAEFFKAAEIETTDESED